MRRLLALGVAAALISSFVPALRRRMVDLLTVTTGTWVGSPAAPRSAPDTGRR